MLKFRYTIRLFKAFVSKFKVILLAGVVVGFLFFAGFFYIFPNIFSNSTQIIGYIGRFTAENLPEYALKDIGQGLTSINEEGYVNPSLASSWETPDEGRTWIFHLDASKKWQDGKSIDSQSINYNFKDVEVEKPDDLTIVFKLKERFSPFPSVVSKPVFKKGLLGTGKWRVVNLSLVGNFVEKITLQDKDSKKKIIKFYPTEDQAKLAFKLGHIDRISDLVDPKPLSDWSTASIEGSPMHGRYVAVFFNNQDPLFKDSKPLRQALSYAINKDALSSNRALGPISDKSWAYNPQTKDYGYDIKRAKELLRDLPKEAKENITVKLTTTSVLLDDAEKIVKDWREIGIKAETAVSAGIPSDYQAFLAIYDTPNDPDQYVTWHSSQNVTNISKYSDERIDNLLEEGRRETDQSERKKIYLDFQRFLLEDAPAVFLYHPISYTIIRK